MNKFQKWLLGLVTVAVVVLLGVAFFPVNSGNTGAGGGDHYFYEQFFSGLGAHVVVDLGSVQTLSAAATTTTVTAAQICSGDTINWNPTNNNATATIDTTANLQANCLNNNGNSIFLNLTNTAATNTYNVVWPTNYTVFHPNAQATTTITSSTPASYQIFLTAKSTTSTVSSTFAVYRSSFVTP